MNKAMVIVSLILGGIAMLSALAVIVALFVKAEVSAQLKEAGIVPPAKIEAMESDIGRNTDDIDEIEDRWNALVDAVAGSQ